MRKLLSMVLAITLVLANTVMVFAEDPCTHVNKTFVENVWESGDCTKSGAKAKYKCDDCGADVLEDITENAEHTYTTYANKCDVCGSISTHTCTYGGEIKGSEVTWTDNDCTKGGTITKPCDLCGKDTVVTVLANTEHIHTGDITGIVWTDNDCTKGGTASVTCDDCNVAFDVTVLPNAEHTIDFLMTQVNWVNNDCTKGGSVHGVCKVCGQEADKSVEARESHSITPPINCAEHVRIKCDYCDYTEIYTPTDTCEHNGEVTSIDWGTDCTQSGIAHFVCTKCGKNATKLVEPNASHSYDESGDGKCIRCAHSCTHQGEVIPYYEYNADDKHVRKFECAICHKKDVTPVGLVEPDTCTAECSDYQTYESVDETTHKFGCSVCGHELAAREAHTFDSDGHCTKCGFTCTHENKEYTHINGTLTHKVTCKNCTAVLQPTEDCNSVYVAIDKDNHKQACELCKEDYSEARAHTFMDGSCIYCAYSCTHDNVDTVFNNNTHTIKCKHCSKVVEKDTPCTFVNNKCSVCNGTRICNHDKESEYVYVSANVHKKVCKVCEEIITNAPCTFNKMANKCDDCGHITEHSHTYNTDGKCTKCGAECPHSQDAYTSLGNNRHAVVCAACGKIKKYDECTFFGGTICSKCNTQHVHKYSYENVSTSQHRMNCSICGATATESHQIVYEYKGKDGDDYEHYKKCKLCDFSKIENCNFNKGGKRCEYCDHRKDDESSSSSSGSSGSSDYVHGTIGSGNNTEAMKAEPRKYLDELRKSGVALQKGTVLAITGNEYNELCAVESSLRDTNNQLMYAHYFGTALGYTKFSPTKTYNIYPLWSEHMKNSAAIVSWANTGCQYGDTVYVVWYSYDAHDMRLIPAVVDQNGVVSAAIPKVTSMSIMTVVKCEKEAPKKQSEVKTQTKTETKTETTETKSTESTDNKEDDSKSDTKATSKSSEISNKTNKDETTSLTVKTD